MSMDPAETEALKIACPRCRVKPGEPCYDGVGKPLPSEIRYPHVRRFQLAWPLLVKALRDRG